MHFLKYNFWTQVLDVELRLDINIHIYIYMFVTFLNKDAPNPMLGICWDISSLPPRSLHKNSMEFAPLQGGPVYRLSYDLPRGF